MTNLTAQEITDILCQTPERITNNTLPKTQKNSPITKLTEACRRVFTSNDPSNDSIKTPPQSEWEDGSLAQAITELRVIGMSDENIQRHLNFFEAIVEEKFKIALGDMALSQNSTSFRRSDISMGLQHPFGVRYLCGDVETFRKNHRSGFEQQVREAYPKFIETIAIKEFPDLLEAKKIHKVKQGQPDEPHNYSI